MTRFEDKEYWRMAKKVSQEVAKWPKWKREIKIGYTYTTSADDKLFSDILNPKET